MNLRWLRDTDLRHQNFLETRQKTEKLYDQKLENFSNKTQITKSTNMLSDQKKCNF